MTGTLRDPAHWVHGKTTLDMFFPHDWVLADEIKHLKMYWSFYKALPTNDRYNAPRENLNFKMLTQKVRACVLVKNRVIRMRS